MLVTISKLVSPIRRFDHAVLMILRSVNIRKIMRSPVARYAKIIAGFSATYYG